MNHLSLKSRVVPNARVITAVVALLRAVAIIAVNVGSRLAIASVLLGLVLPLFVLRCANRKKGGKVIKET